MFFYEGIITESETFSVLSEEVNRKQVELCRNSFEGDRIGGWLEEEVEVGGSRAREVFCGGTLQNTGSTPLGQWLGWLAGRVSFSGLGPVPCEFGRVEKAVGALEQLQIQ